MFMPHSAIQKYCNREHYRVCPVCGERFLVPRDKLSNPNAVCSKKCQYRGLSNGSLKKKIVKVCEICGEEFESSVSNQRICNKDHYLICSVCGTRFLAPRWKLLSNSQTCSPECGSILSKRTYQQHYGKDANPEAHDALIAKQEATMMTRYGTRNAFTNEGKELFVKDKLIEKYGVDHPMKCKEILERRNETTIARYGSSCSATSQKVKDKSIQTCMERYGVDNYAKSSAFLKQVITEPEKADNCKEFRDDPESYVKLHFPDKKPTLAELSESCGIRDSSVGWILDQAGHPDIVSYCYSKMEDELYRFLVDQLGPDAKIERNTFKIITPYELDIYLPDYNFAIECNPTITHNSTIPGWSKNDDPKPTGYHKMKTDLCEKQGIFLFHIFGYEWSHHSEILTSMLRNILQCNTDKLYARTLILKEVSDSDSMKFLNENHRQGGAHCSIRLGLYNGQELVSLMTFSKMRKTIGTGKQDTTDCYELVRFCNKLNTTVVGGASKLFKSFLRMYGPTEVRSFSDRAHTRGSLYSTLGFKYDHTSDPGYMWVGLKTDRGYARNNAQKNNIKSFLKDDSIDLNKTEVQIMKEHNFVQVFDSGVKLWIWRKEDS